MRARLIVCNGTDCGTRQPGDGAGASEVAAESGHRTAGAEEAGLRALRAIEPSRWAAAPGAVAPAVQLPEKSPAELAREALGYANSDFVFDGSMEGNFDRGYATYSEFVKGVAQLGLFTKSPAHKLHHPLVVKTPEIAPDPAAVGAQIGKQLNLGVSGVMFVSVESADEVRQAARRDALQVEGRHALRGRRHGARAVGPERSGVQGQGRPVAAQSRRRADQLDHRREQGRPGEGARDRRGQGHRRAVARRRHAARHLQHHATPTASASWTRRRGKRRSSRCSRRARNSTCRAATPPTPTTSRCA